jgi:hypothetical protein
VNHLIGVVATSLIFVAPVFGQKLVDPAAVAPEYRDAAEHRRAEQLKQRDCGRKADQAKILMRDRAAFVLKCIESADAGK